MVTNVPTLFDLSKLENRKTLSQTEFEKKHAELLMRFMDSVYDSFKTYHEKLSPHIRPGGMVNSWPASTINSLIRSAMIDHFPAYCAKATKSRFKLVGEEDQNIYLKKFNRRLRPTNRQSKANDLILYQLTSSNKDKGGNVFFGYTTDPTSSAPQEIYAVCLLGDELLWQCDIHEFARRQEAAKLIRMTPKAKKAKLKPGVLGLKKKKNQKE